MVNECFPGLTRRVVIVIENGVFNGDISELVQAANVDLHPLLDVMTEVLGEAEDAAENDGVNQVVVSQLVARVGVVFGSASRLPDHGSHQAAHGVDLLGGDH